MLVDYENRFKRREVLPISEMSIAAEIERCRAEQRRCAESLREHGPHRGAELGASDWFREEMILMGKPPLKAPFPWFGGKSRVARQVWDRFGAVPNYVEPFFGSGAVLLGRPHAPRTETVNDRDCMVANFWRALQADADGVAQWADSPVNEADQHARHLWLISQADFRERMKTDPDYFDSKIAGWWVWGQCIWIGSGWCSKPRRKRPHLGNAGKGVHRQLPHLGDAGKGIVAYMHELATRLRGVRVCCGEWDRVTGPSVTFKHGLTGFFLDPPYSSEARDENLYTCEDDSVAHAARAWAIENGGNPLMRIALCGYAGEHEMPQDWECVEWKAKGGYGSQSADGRGRDNSSRERIWFSPHCLRTTLFSMLEYDGE